MYHPSFQSDMSAWLSCDNVASASIFPWSLRLLSFPGKHVRKSGFGAGVLVATSTHVFLFQWSLLYASSIATEAFWMKPDFRHFKGPTRICSITLSAIAIVQLIWSHSRCTPICPSSMAPSSESPSETTHWSPSIQSPTISNPMLPNPTRNS